MVTYSTQPIAATTAARSSAEMIGRPAPFSRCTRLVGIDFHDEYVAERRRLVEAFDVAAVQHVEAPVGEDDVVAGTAVPGQAAGRR